MNCRTTRTLLAALSIVFLALQNHLQAAPATTNPSDTTHTNPPPRVALMPTADDMRIARLTAQLLERFQYSRLKFDDSISSSFLDRLIKDLDPQRMHFLKCDVNDFAHYRKELDDLTMKYGDSQPGFEIFERFLKRLEQRVEYSKEVLNKEKFDFTADEKVVVNRKDMPFPANMDEARKLWRERLRFDYLQEKLNQPATNAITTFTTNSATKVVTTNTTPRTPQQIHEEITKTLTRRYDRTLKTFRDWDSDNVFQFYLDTLAHVYDPHSDYFGKIAADDFAISMNLSLFGIGALLTQEDGYCKIKELKPGPAAKDGRIKPGDRIVAVAQGTNEPVDVVDMPLPKTVQLIRGAKDSEVRLTVWPVDATDSSTRKVIALIRDEIKLEDQQAKAKIILSPDGKGNTNRLGVINLPSFYASMDNPSSTDKAEPRSTTDDIAKLIKKFQQENVKGIILDLRLNGGGSLEEAIRLTGLFIRKGTVVQVREPSGVVMTDDDDDPDQLYSGPLVVLTSRFSASASEIVAGALQDYGRALIVGDSSTHGKGTVQSLMPLLRFPGAFPRGDYSPTNNPGELKITIRKFYRPSGSSTQLRGVIPDIILPSVNNLAEVGETNLDNALPWDTIQAANYEPLTWVKPYIEELKQLSSNRVSQEPEYAYVLEDMDLFKKALADKTVSLNESQRLKEKQENEARDKARRQARTSRADGNNIEYNLTLKQAEQPGLPPLVAESKSVASAASTKQVASAGHGDLGENEEEKAPAIDVNLREAQNILLDYISLRSKNAMAVVEPAKPATTPDARN